MELENSYNSIYNKFKFEHHGGNLLISDTIVDYEEVLTKFIYKQQKDIASEHVIKNLPMGYYDVFINEGDYGQFGKRVKEIVFFNENYNYEYNNISDWNYLFNLTVDTGSCLFISESILENKLDFDIFLEKWLIGQCDGNILPLTINNSIVSFAVNSGYGDGIYDFFAYYSGNQIVGIKVSFINNENTGLPSDYDSSNSYDISSESDSSE